MNLAEIQSLARRGAHHMRHNRRYLSVRKLANAALINIQHTLKTERVYGRPYKVRIESTNICNTTCQLCPTGIGLNGRSKGVMDLDSYQRLVDEFADTMLVLDLSMWGDPLIAPQIYDMVRYAHDRRVWTYISSNLHAYKLKTKPGRTPDAERLVECGLDVLVCSLHGATQRSFEIYQPGKKFDLAVEKVRQIVETRDRLGSRSPEVRLNFVVTRHNEHEIESFKALAAELGARALFADASMNTRFASKDNNLQDLGLSEDEVQSRASALVNEWLPENEAFRRPFYEALQKGEFSDEDYNGSKPVDCDWLWRQAVVNWDGNVSPCCGSFEPNEDMGNVLERPFGKIWNNEKYRTARRSFKHKIPGAKAANNACVNCPGIMM